MTELIQAILTAHAHGWRLLFEVDANGIATIGLTRRTDVHSVGDCAVQVDFDPNVKGGLYAAMKDAFNEVSLPL